MLLVDSSNTLTALAWNRYRILCGTGSGKLRMSQLGCHSKVWWTLQCAVPQSASLLRCLLPMKSHAGSTSLWLWRVEIRIWAIFPRAQSLLPVGSFRGMAHIRSSPGPATKNQNSNRDHISEFSPVPWSKKCFSWIKSLAVVAKWVTLGSSIAKCSRKLGSSDN